MSKLAETRSRVIAAILALMLAAAAACLPACASSSGGAAQGQGSAPEASQASDAEASSPEAAPANTQAPQAPAAAPEDEAGLSAVTEDGHYTSKGEVAYYLHTYGHLPSNYITKSEARDAGWVSSEGNLGEVCPGMSIGGDVFHNDEGLLPEAPGREYRECDIDYAGGRRNAKRIVYSNDGLIYYTGDHYNSFEQLY